MVSVLVAGIGNVLKGDDGIGVWVARELMKKELPKSVSVIDYGISIINLIYDMPDFEYVVIIDAIDKGRGGEVFLLKIEEEDIKEDDVGSVDFHRTSIDEVLKLAKKWKMFPKNGVFVVGIAPVSIEDRPCLSDRLSSNLRFFTDYVINLLNQVLKT